MAQMRMNLEWENFFATQVALIEEEEAAAEEETKMIEASIILTAKPGELNVKRAERDQDEEVRSARIKHRDLKGRRKLLITLMESRARTRDFLSREETRRLERAKHGGLRVERSTP